MITIFTDGSARGNPGPGGWGAVISYKKIVDSREEDWVMEIGGSEKFTTNNRMELKAAIRALETAPSLSTNYYLLCTDSQYVMKGITEWIHNWIAKGWKTAAKKPVENQDLWQALLKNTEGKHIEWKYVEGHAGIPGNERCDAIATSFADGVEPDLYEGPRESYSISLRA